MGRYKVAEFTWTKNHTVNEKRPVKNADRTNRFVYPSISDNYTLISGAMYNYNKGVLNIELTQHTPFEWLDTRRMRNEVGRKVAEVLGAKKWLYYADQPVGSTRGRGYCHFQQFCTQTGIPKDEDLVKVYEILRDGAIEGEECGEFKRRNYNSGAVPLRRDYNTLAKKRKRQFEEYERQMEQEFGG